MTVIVKKQSNPEEKVVEHITRGSDNIFADLGFEHEEAAKLLAETDAAVMKCLDMRQRSKVSESKVTG
jgi:hypothetical protein